MSTATPTQDTVTKGLRSLLSRLTAAGWDIEAPGVTAPASAAYCMIARAPDAEEGTEGPSHLIYVYVGEDELHIDDLWRLVSDTRLAGADHAVMCLGGAVVLSAAARSTAALLQVRVLRLVD